MFFLKLIDVTKSFSDNKTLIENLNLTLSEKNVLGIIGKNGQGKTTLLKLVAKELELDYGQIIISDNSLCIGYHTQFLDIPEVSDMTIEEYILKNFPKIYRLQSKISKIINEIELTPDKSKKSSLIEGLLVLQSKFDELGGYIMQSKIDEALVKLGLDLNSSEKVNILSGGQKTRLQLAKIIIQDPDILLLDEPTNHLDREAITWLENYISSRNGITIIVSHDRSFLNNTTNQILELENGQSKLYYGNYDTYFSEKELRIEKNLQAIKDSEKKLVKLKEALNVQKSQAFQDANKNVDKIQYGKFAKGSLLKKSGVKARRAKLFERRINNQIENNKVLKPVKYRRMGFKIEALESIGDFVLRIKDLKINTSGQELLCANLEVLREEKVSISGENGSGKTTLVKTILNNYDQKLFNLDAFTITGEVKFGGNIKIGYYSQEHEEVDLNLTVVEDFRKANPMLESEASQYLFRMLFTHEQMHQKVSDLSQGEKSKLALTKLLVQQHNLLILDEPTNHLDIASREVLENALRDYEGSILCISHDKFFLEKIGIDKEYNIFDKKLVIR